MLPRAACGCMQGPGRDAERLGCRAEHMAKARRKAAVCLRAAAWGALSVNALCSGLRRRLPAERLVIGPDGTRNGSDAGQSVWQKRGGLRRGSFREAHGAPLSDGPSRSAAGRKHRAACGTVGCVCRSRCGPDRLCGKNGCSGIRCDRRAPGGGCGRCGERETACLPKAKTVRRRLRSACGDFARCGGCGKPSPRRGRGTFWLLPEDSCGAACFSINKYHIKERRLFFGKPGTCV